MSSRRTFFEALASLPFFSTKATAAKLKTPDYFKDLGIRPFINAAGTYTTLTASLMPQEVMDAMEYASKHFVHLTKVQDAVGARIATLLQAESAMVTSGASGALTVGTAGCITGTDNKKILQIPDLTGLKDEVLVQKAHRYGYDHAVRACGVKMIEIETEEEFHRKASPRTAMALFFNDAEKRGRIDGKGWVQLGKQHGIPTFIDASADSLPVERLSLYNKMGFDLVTFSGGKGICAPQSTGILMGRKNLIEAARLNTSPYSDSIARGMKVNKEEMIGLLVALEMFLKRDHNAEWKEWERRVDTIRKSAEKLPTVTSSVEVPEIANHTPHLKMTWDQSKIKISPLEVKKKLFDTEPCIEVTPSTDQTNLVVTVWMLKPGEAEIVAKRIQDVLKSAVA
ncbi:aminotransferase class V-fold PLP-dependent enzyme [Bryobacter aggregatus]|uniref:aminotransferase class V-fold PLP-dependent enzyme n=1 Tax=Bryobacter aggregatus TaxID=360054 RepID=UPI0004E17E1D|nr:aminotransferase class V-fold PLP-dependent enzyme [Bryobacter aggregatus]